MAAHLRARLGEHAPQVIVVEPDKAACVFFSSISNRSVRVAEEAPTIMGMLECYEPSLIAWNILERSAAAFLTVADNDGLRAMARLATPFVTTLRCAVVKAGGRTGRAAGLHRLCPRP
ncbi:diaminopropionate ammonia-lyase [Klebsiella variicola]|uniref:Diaminopropionate ammonia-lyase n=1 Tax=Klebsiella variicola TaxID=244366 RepID=A0A7H4N3X6_KLEVA|nr:diaminopropionate ammonia-lyase [Klebsiella variicola]